ncbi:hypothetical protein [Nonomuraea diastatica]|uniref:Uncharacterized protein n=1 Tax=Nonomuraea diastatica TaxID=1848329 RepID=A0A4R4X1Y1_9ACTN|nr:hypothetical protein [Nonomuraea diastatica]TDD24214.1 hypothetical protein E1294_06920 [Nonomuraea diastatica]
MFKRRLAVLGAVATLAVTGLAGSALADEPAGPTAGTKVICKTSDGKTIELIRAKPVRGVKVATRDGKVTKAEPGTEPSATVELKDGDHPKWMKAKPLPEGEVLPDVPFKDGAVTLKPARPADGSAIEDGATPPEGVAKTVRITCEKAE